MIIGSAGLLAQVRKDPKEIIRSGLKARNEAFIITGSI
jgi:hypothetical protein